MESKVIKRQSAGSFYNVRLSDGSLIQAPDFDAVLRQESSNGWRLAGVLLNAPGGARWAPLDVFFFSRSDQDYATCYEFKRVIFKKSAVDDTGVMWDGDHVNQVSTYVTDFYHQYLAEQAKEGWAIAAVCGGPVNDTYYFMRALPAATKAA